MLKYLPFLLGFFIFPTQISQASEAAIATQLIQVKGCVNCHGLDGISQDLFIPNLAGQKLKYLRKQIENFQRQGAKRYQVEKVSERHHPQMSLYTNSLTKSDVIRIARYYSKLPSPLPRPTKENLIPKEATRCETCHGGIRTSPFQDIPNLAGQKEGYMLKQLTMMQEAFNNSENKANGRYHRLSELMVEGLSDAEIAIAVRYYANLK